MNAQKTETVGGFRRVYHRVRLPQVKTIRVFPSSHKVRKFHDINKLKKHGNLRQFVSRLGPHVILVYTFIRVHLPLVGHPIYNNSLSLSVLRSSILISSLIQTQTGYQKMPGVHQSKKKKQTGLTFIVFTVASTWLDGVPPRTWVHSQVERFSPVITFTATLPPSQSFFLPSRRSFPVTKTKFSSNDDSSLKTLPPRKFLWSWCTCP